jgi:AcrR family transcriptional regulator
MSKREINKEKVRKRLMEEALRLFSEKGFEQTTVADIVVAAEIGRGTFYNYFSDVKDIFEAVVDKMNAEIQAIIKEGRKETKGIYEHLYVSFKSFLDYASRENFSDFHKKNQAHIRSTSYGSQSVRQLVIDLQNELRAGESIGEFKEDYEFQLLSFVLVGAPAELFLNAHNTKLKISNHQMADFLAKMFVKVLDAKK